MGTTGVRLEEVQEIMPVIRSSSKWALPEIEAFLRECAVPLRIACLTSRGMPIVCSLWYLYDDGALWCATHKDAKVATYLEKHPFCGFEIAPEAIPYRGVRGQGKVTCSPERGLDVLLRLIDRYLGSRDSKFARWLISRASSELAIRIEPVWLTAWDFAPRMGSGRSPGNAA